MKSLKVLVPVIVLAAVAAAPVMRADTTPAPASSAEVKLTPEQQTKITALHKEQSEAIKAVNKDKKMKEADKKKKIKEIKADFKAQIDAVKTGGSK